MIRNLADSRSRLCRRRSCVISCSLCTAYGQLSKRSQDEMIAGARVDVAPYKKNPGGFRPLEAVGA